MKSTDKVISIIREMMVANQPGKSGGFSSSSPAKGPTAGFDTLIKLKKTKNDKIDYRKVPESYKRWVKNIENK
jgi:hypothetical protein